MEEPALDPDLAAAVADVARILDGLSVPALVVDRDLTVVWENDAGLNEVDARGRRATDLVVEPERRRVTATLEAVLRGETENADIGAHVVRPSGEVFFASVSYAPLRLGGEIVGLVGMVASPTVRVAANVQLTARQMEVLVLLADGLTTDEIASRLVIARETARNHIKAVLSALHVRNRLGAVLKAQELGLLSRRG
jgi:PAS domain S-box-containing protein